MKIMSTITAVPSLSTQLLAVALLTLQRQLAHNQINPNENSPFSTSKPEAVDFIVVGGGTAGCIVASRVADSDVFTSVLILEAGGPMTVTREMTGLIDFSSQIWPYSIVQSNRSSLAFNQLYLPYGKVLGGSSTISFNYYNRGNGLVYDSWSQEFGARGWSSQEVLSYFRMSENNTDLEVVRARPWAHGTEGPVEISTTPNPDSFLLKWRSIVHEKGWPLADFADLDPGAQFGVSIPQVTQSSANWTRRTSASAYIEGRERRNLRVELNAHVTKVLFSGRSAIGVQYFQNGRNLTVYARQEVILSAGTFNTPQLLMLSGVGPQKHLKSLGIPVLADLPVGSTLISHPNMLLDFILLNRFLVNDQNPVGAEQTTISTLYDFLSRAQGPLRQFPSTMVYYETGINGDRRFPDVFAYSGGPALYAGTFSNPQTLQIFRSETREQWRRYYQALAPTKNTTYAFTNFLLVRPRSTGNVRLASTNPFDLPIIDLGYFRNPQDLAAIVKGLSMGFELFERSQEAQKFLMYSKLPVPGCSFCKDGRPLSRCQSYLACLARTVTFSDGHDCCTAKMGSSKADNSSYVLDERLRVRTLRRLRVVDASAMPTIPNGNTMAPTMMVAERGAVLVLEDNK